MTALRLIAIAAMLKETNQSCAIGGQAPDIYLADLCNDMADYFADQNPLFDRTRFLTACGLGE